MMLRHSRRNFSKVYKNYINGAWVESQGTQKIDIINPLDQSVLAQVPQSTDAEFQEAVANSAETFKTWKDVPISTKVRYMLKYQELLKQNQDEIAAMVTKEHGKSLLDSKGDVFRGYEVVEHACSFGSLAMGESL